MKIKFVILFIIVCINSIFANGVPERDRQAYGQIQLKIVNLTENTIKFYFNRLYTPREINSQEEFVTMSTPVNIQHPGFIGIEQNNDGNIKIYHFQNHHNFRHNIQYFVLVMETNIQFILGNIDEQINYFDESLYESRWRDYDWPIDQIRPLNEVSNWEKIRLGSRFINLKIVNNSGLNKIVHVNTVLENMNAPLGENRTHFNIGNGMTVTYTIDYELFRFGGIQLRISDNRGVSFFTNFTTSSYSRLFRLSLIELKLNLNGHEITYHDVN